MYEDKGRQVPRHRAISKHPDIFGRLSLTEQSDRELRRSVRTARLCGVGDGLEILPRLRDAVILWIADGRMTITGFETDEVENKSYVQSWYVEVCQFSDAPAANADEVPPAP